MTGATIEPPASRNARCPCGSGLRYKECHGAFRALAQAPTIALRAPIDAGRHSDAAARVDALLADAAVDLDALRLAGEAAVRAGDTAHAAKAWNRLLEARPDDVEALFHAGSLARVAGDVPRAIDLLERARAAVPRHGAVLNNLALALEAAGRLADAEIHLRTALDATPDAFEPLANLAQNLYRQRLYGEALPWFERLVGRFDVAEPAVWANRAVCLRAAGRLADAAASFCRALAGSGGTPAATLVLEHALIHVELHAFDVAAAGFERYLALRPDSLEALSGLLFARQHLADWRDFASLRDRVLSRIAASDGTSGDCAPPFNVLTICDDPAIAHEAARLWARQRVRAVADAPPPSPQAHDRLRLAFVSSDLYDHPVGRLVVGLVEQLDRSRYHVTLMATGDVHDDATARRLRTAADAFHVVGRDVVRAARTLRDERIDIAFDLGGYTHDAPVDLFAMRPAPWQAGFLGFTGTSGSPAYDFIVADRHCVPPAEARHYSEAPICVDPCYLPSDPARALDAVPPRSAYGLADDAFVLCAFAATYKILPDVFAAWMRVLGRHQRAVLWLRDAGDGIDGRLMDAARRHGIAPSRLAFAPSEPLGRYLARFRLADLFLDTAPFGAHTTLNDALFAGLPAVTLEGRTFAARASASQLRAANLGELVASSLDDYVAIVDRLAGDRMALIDATTRLRDAGKRSPLFDMKRYAEAFGAAVEAAVAARGRRDRSVLTASKASPP